MRNEPLAMSLDVSTKNSSLLPQLFSSRQHLESEMSNTSLINSFPRHMGIELKEMLAETQRFQNKIRSPVVPNLERAGYFTISKSKGKDFISTVQKQSNPVLSPFLYKRSDLDLFKIKDKSRIPFYLPKATKVSVMDESAKTHAFVPGSPTYNVKLRTKTIGTIKM